NDTVLMLASGAAGGKPVVPGTTPWRSLVGAVEDVAGSLVAQLADDAEGASHVAIVEVTGAATDEDARAVAKAVAGSLLVKTAVFGGDPNPGRVRVRIGDATVVAGGTVVPSYFAPDGARKARAALERRHVVLGIELGT